MATPGQLHGKQPAILSPLDSRWRAQENGAVIHEVRADQQANARVGGAVAAASPEGQVVGNAEGVSGSPEVHLRRCEAGSAEVGLLQTNDVEVEPNPRGDVGMEAGPLSRGSGKQAIDIGGRKAQASRAPARRRIRPPRHEGGGRGAQGEKSKRGRGGRAQAEVKRSQDLVGPQGPTHPHRQDQSRMPSPHTGWGPGRRWGCAGNHPTPRGGGGRG